MKPTFRDYLPVSNHLTPRHNPEDGRFQFNRGGSLRLCKDLPVKLLVPQILKECPAFDITHKFVTVFTTAATSPYPEANKSSPRPCHPIPRRSILILSSYPRLCIIYLFIISVSLIPVFTSVLSFLVPSIIPRYPLTHPRTLFSLSFVYSLSGVRRCHCESAPSNWSTVLLTDDRKILNITGITTNYLTNQLHGAEFFLKFPALYGTRSSLPHSQEPATLSSPESDQSSSCPHPIFRISFVVLSSLEL